MRRPGHSTVVAYLALFMSVAGGAYAASRIDSGDIEDASIHSRDLAQDSGVKGKDVAEGSLSGSDVADDSLGGADVDEETLSLGRDETVLLATASEPGGVVGEFWMSPSGTTVDSSGRPQITPQRSEATLVTPKFGGDLLATHLSVSLEEPAGGQRGFELILSGAHTNLGCVVETGQTGCIVNDQVQVPAGSELSLKSFISTGPGVYGDYIRTALRLEG